MKKRLLDLTLARRVRDIVLSLRRAFPGVYLARRILLPPPAPKEHVRTMPILGRVFVDRFISQLGPWATFHDVRVLLQDHSHHDKSVSLRAVIGGHVLVRQREGRELLPAIVRCHKGLEDRTRRVCGLRGLALYPKGIGSRLLPAFEEDRQRRLAAQVSQCAGAVKTKVPSKISIIIMQVVRM